MEIRDQSMIDGSLLFFHAPLRSTMSAIPPAVSQALQAQHQASRQQIDYALLGKHLEAQKQAGETVNQMLSQAAEVQKQLAAGHLDVRV